MAVTDQPVDGIRRNRSIELLNSLEDGFSTGLTYLSAAPAFPPVLLAGFCLPFDEIHGRRSARPVVLQRFG